MSALIKLPSDDFINFDKVLYIVFDRDVDFEPDRDEPDEEPDHYLKIVFDSRSEEYLELDGLMAEKCYNYLVGVITK